MKALTPAQRIAHFLGEDMMNVVFVTMAIERYVAEVEQIDATKDDRRLISARLLKDIAQDWKNGN